jgi:hypothetical protein
MKTLLLRAIVQDHIEASRKRNNKLVQIFVSMAAALGSARNVVKIINTLDVKGDMASPLNECEVAPWVADFGEVNSPALR